MTKILLVEDDKNLREIYGVRLLAEGYDIVSAGDGEEALAMAIKERPALIVSDVMMPKISGFDMLDILQSTTETKDIKVIMMTALSGEDQRQRGEQLGAAKYLVKSQVGIEDVVQAVHEVLGDQPDAAPSVITTTSYIDDEDETDGRTVADLSDESFTDGEVKASEVPTHDEMDINSNLATEFSDDETTDEDNSSDLNYEETNQPKPSTDIPRQPMAEIQFTKKATPETTETSPASEQPSAAKIEFKSPQNDQYLGSSPTTHNPNQSFGSSEDSPSQSAELGMSNLNQTPQVDIGAAESKQVDTPHEPAQPDFNQSQSDADPAANPIDPAASPSEPVVNSATPESSPVEEPAGDSRPDQPKSADNYKKVGGERIIQPLNNDLNKEMEDIAKQIEKELSDMPGAPGR